MKTVLFGIIVVVLMAAAGGAGYYFGNANGLQSATNVQREFFTSRGFGTGQGNGQGAAAQGTPGAGQAGAFAQGGRPTASGVVKSVQGNTITVTQRDGSATTVTVDDKTQYTKMVSGSISDVTAGLNIVVTDVNNVKRIQLTPAQSQ